jgi:hypothetical protein
VGHFPHNCEIFLDKLESCLKPQQIILVAMPLLQL